MKNKAHFKYNNGNLSLNCSKCNKVIKVGSEFSEDEMKACQAKIYFPPQYCDACIIKNNNISL